jgi:type IV pilus assembly protein PilV
MHRQQGFTLVEVMVAFLVMAIGLLGVIGLQNTAIRSNFNSTAQMQAVLLAKEMADLLRANPEGVEEKSYDLVNGQNISACVSSSCSADDMAKFDKYLWDRRVAENLGADAEGVVCIDSTPDDGTSASSHGCDGDGDAWVVKLWWTEGDAAVAGERTTADLIFLDKSVDRPSYFASFMP